MDIHKKIIESLTWRRAIRVFDTTKKVSDENLQTILKSANLSPSSFGLEPWKFIVVTDTSMRKKLRIAGYDQPKITDASHLVVITHRTDSSNLSTELITRNAKVQNKTVENLTGLKDMVDGAISRKETDTARNAWLISQSYIALGIMIETASLLGIDNAPMEGFDTQAVNEILGLTKKNLSVVTMLALGYRDEEGLLSQKVRRNYGDVIEFI